MNISYMNTWAVTVFRANPTGTEISFSTCYIKTRLLVILADYHTMKTIVSVLGVLAYVTS